jgi:hypothetical protein
MYGWKTLLRKAKASERLSVTFRSYSGFVR